MIVGLCGGYQMLGRLIADPLGIEGTPAKVEGLGLLDVETVLSPAKVLRRVTRSEEHTSELQSLMRISYAVFCLKKKKKEQSKRDRHSTTRQDNASERITERQQS